MKHLFVLLLLPLPLFAGKSYTATIIVIDDDTSEPIENASIYFDGVEFGKTDANGRLVRENCKETFYSIRTKKDGYYAISNAIYSHKAKFNQKLLVRLISTDGPNISKEKLAYMEKVKASYDDAFEQEFKALKATLAKVDTNTVLPCSEDTSKNKDNLYILTNEENSHFPGGSNEFNKYIVENIEYPEAAIDRDEQGKVYLAFDVETDGSITNIEILRGVSESLDAEAFRIIYGMPKWIPAHCNGRIIKSSQHIPVVFSLY